MVHMVVDRRHLNRLLREIDEHVKLLEAVRDKPLEELLEDPLRFYGIQYALVVCVEMVLVAAYHLIAEYRFAGPETKEDAMTILVRNKVILDEALANRLPKMVRFRNLIVHRYWDVDSAIVYRILQENLNDFSSISEAIVAYVTAHPER